MQQLGEQMTGEEFGLHLGLEDHEPLTPGQSHAVASLLASQANGPIDRKDGRRWLDSDFAPERWPPIDDDALPPPKPANLTVEQIRAQARAAGMQA